MTKPREPAAFRLDDKHSKPKTATRPGKTKVREPQAITDLDAIRLVVADIDAFEEEAASQKAVEPKPATKVRKSYLGRIFSAALGLLFTLAVGLWIEDLILETYARSTWLGWAAAGVAAIAAVTLLAILVRELLAILRLRSVTHLRKRAEEVLQRNDAASGRRLVSELMDFTKSNPATASGRKTLSALKDDVIDGADLVRIAERELFSHLDRQAKRIILDSAKRVSVVTAVSPRALVDVAFVVIEAGRLMRRLSQHYGSRPGTLGFFKLARDVIAHLAVTGSIAVGDSLVQQVIGHGLAARLSARLGEGIVNGLMTVRIGIAAMETVRPLPFAAVRRPSMSDFLSGLMAASEDQNTVKG